MTTTTRRLLLWGATMLAGIAGLTPGGTDAADYPARTITVLVPHAAGGPTDTVARLVAQSMSGTLGQAVIVENVGGAGSTLGTARAAKAEPDGYTLLLNHVAQATSATLYRKLPYDPVGAFVGIGLITDVPMTVVAKQDFEPGSIAELIQHVKAEKDKISYAHAGVGSASHLCGMLLMEALEASMTTVPYKGTGPAMNDMLGGQVDMMCDQTTNTVSQIKGGRIKGYAVTTKARLPVLPGLPTLGEAGLGGFEMTVWHGLYAPNGTPKEAVDKLVPALQAALKDPNVVERFRDLGTEPVAADRATPEALERHLRAEVAKWQPVIKAAGVYAE